MGLPFSIIPHTADLQVHVEGKTLESLFRNALIVMFQSIKPEAPECEYRDNILICPSLPKKHIVEINAIDKEALLVDFLSEALYLSDLHNEAYLDVEIKNFSEKHLGAQLCGVRIEGFENEIKAVTYHDLHIEKEKDMWQVNIVFDI